MKTITYLLVAFLLPYLVNAQLQNLGFERWRNPVTNELVAPNRPIGWEISNGRAFLPNLNAYFPVVTAAHSGNYALMLGIWYNYTKDMATQTATINTRPTALTGYYKYSRNRVTISTGEIDDQASATVYLTKWDSARSRRDTIGRGEVLLNAAADYTAFTCPITYLSTAVPDRVTVMLDCSLMNRPGFQDVFVGNEGVASFFTVDSLAFTEESLGTDINNQNFTTYPNPATDILNFHDLKGMVQVYDSTGKLVLSQPEFVTNISVLNLKQGVYYLQLYDGSITRRSKFIKK